MLQKQLLSQYVATLMWLNTDATSKDRLFLKVCTKKFAESNTVEQSRVIFYTATASKTYTFFF